MKFTINKINTSFLAILFISGLLTACVGNQAAQSTKELHVVVMTWGGAAPGFVAQRMGYFDDLNVKISVVDDSAARVDAFAYNGDLYLTNPDQVPIDITQRGIKGSMVLISDMSLGADGMLVDSTIENLSDLKGKKIVYVQGSAAELMLAKALETAGLTYEDVELIAVDDPSVSVASLGKSDVSAVLTWEPILSEAENSAEGAKILFTSKDIPDTILGVFIAKPELIADEEKLETFIDGWLQAVEFIEKQPEQAMTIIADGFNLEQEDAISLMNGLQLADKQMNKEWLTNSSAGSTRATIFAEEAAQHWNKQGLLDTIPSLKELEVPLSVQNILNSL